MAKNNETKKEGVLRLDFDNVISEAKEKALAEMDKDIPSAVLKAREEAKKGSLIIHNHKILF